MSDPMKLEMWDIDKLIPYENNNKTHPPEQIEALAHQISKGWDQPIVVDKHGSIIKGHGRRLAALKLGQKQVPVYVRRDLSPNEVRAIRVADNKISALGEFDEAALRRELESLAQDSDLTALDVGYASDEELVALLGGDVDSALSDLLDEDEVSSQSSTSSERKLPKEAEYVRAFQLVVECQDEEDQGKAYDMLTTAGYKVRALEA